MQETELRKQLAESLLDDAYLYNLNGETTVVEATTIVFGDKDFVEPKPCRFGYALLHTAHGAHLARQSKFGGHTYSGRDRNIDIAGKDGTRHGKVYGGVADAYAAGNV